MNMYIQSIVFALCCILSVSSHSPEDDNWIHWPKSGRNVLCKKRMEKSFFPWKVDCCHHHIIPNKMLKYVWKNLWENIDHADMSKVRELLINTVSLSLPFTNPSTKESMTMKSYDRIIVEKDMVDVKYVRSSGPGGQNVNKLSTKAEVRFNVYTVPWLPAEVRSRLAVQQATRINKAGEIVLYSDAERTQGRNLRDCLKKLQSIVDKAIVEPKERKIWEGIGEKTKAKRRRQKEHRKNIKSGRRGPSGRDAW
eukprot:GSMAST32.ASY1.ANO1.556.1 assembled CDS